MKKILFGFAMAAAATFATGLTSCSSDDILGTESNEEEVTYSVIANISLADDESRAGTTISSAGIKTIWEEGDKLLITSIDGSRNLGVLEAKNQNGNINFVGNIKARPSDSEAHIYYLGESMKNQDLSDLRHEITLDLSNHGGLIDNYNDFNVQHTTSPLKREGNNINIEGKLKCVLAAAKFYLHLPEGVTATEEDIIISGANIKNSVKLNFADATLSDQADGPMTVAKADWTVGEANEGEMYLSFVPTDNAVTQFAITINGKEYKAAIEPHNYLAGVTFSGGSAHGKDVYFVEGEGDDWRLTYNYVFDDMESKVVTAASWSNTYSFTIMANPSRDGFDFLGWAESENGTVQYNAGQILTLTRPFVTKTLYAQWQGKTYTLHYMVDGEEKGTGTKTGSVKHQKTPWIFNPSDDVAAPNKPGYKFLGWADSASATAADYQHNGSINLTPEVMEKTVYAVFKKNGTSGNVTVPGSQGVGY
ncbi:MAG: InlB B-repeat-containing protein [Muribaculaceae bacterium]|nr:InlB B-repeat-containing protein [Muribaculaceae bacterium]